MEHSVRAAGEVKVRPSRADVIWSWLTTVDHKRIGILYLFTSFAFFLLAGALAMIMRTQLAVPDNDFLSPDTYNQAFTVHGTLMVFIVALPLNAAFFNFIVPLMIGARDLAFPRLNAFTYWSYLFGSLLLISGLFVLEGPNFGWTAYAPLATSEAFTPGINTEFYIFGLLVTGTSTMVTGFNFIVTIINMRAPGMSLMRMPVFVWTTLITSILIVLAFQSLTVGLIGQASDRLWGTLFFDPDQGSPVMWQHLFWIFGHPEVYILILPVLGIVAEVLPVFSRKPLFGYVFVVFAAIAIAFLGFSVWVHHMFTVGIGPIPNMVFGTTTMLIAIPTGIKVLNFLGTMWGGSIRLLTPLLYAAAFVATFTIGGISGVMHAAVPIDYWQHDTYFVVAHLHYVLFGGTIMGVFAAIYYWFPKFFGRILDERLGKYQFATTLIGFNLAFFPMHFLGVDGMPRRIYTYPEGLGWDLWNLVATIGAYLLGLSILLLVFMVIKALREEPSAPGDPWDGRTLEWATPSPPPPYDFARIPDVRARDAFWEQKYHGTEEEQRRARQEAESQQTDAEIHMPSPSFIPLLAAASLTLTAIGAMSTLILSAIGVFMLLVCIFAWVNEPIHKNQ